MLPFTGTREYFLQSVQRKTQKSPRWVPRAVNCRWLRGHATTETDNRCRWQFELTLKAHVDLNVTLARRAAATPRPAIVDHFSKADITWCGYPVTPIVSSFHINRDTTSLRVDRVYVTLESRCQGRLKSVFLIKICGGIR
jgi:hypothetical protein